ncbi:MAG TPA: hypothetical protein VLW50_31275 [Streptosporangiaceae bacterium]|nr:hypothetical protein [Streptosporangiaceae bacterium]
MTAMQAFAGTEEEVARIFEELASGHPERRDEYRRTAEQARTKARRAREALRTFTG